DLWRAGCVDEAHVRFGGAARGNGPMETPAPRPGADPYHVNIRLEEHKLCLLVMIGVRADGHKELVALADGYRESAESWADLLRDCTRRGMSAPVLAVGDRPPAGVGTQPEPVSLRCDRLTRGQAALHQPQSDMWASIWSPNDQLVIFKWTSNYPAKVVNTPHSRRWGGVRPRRTPPSFAASGRQDLNLRPLDPQ